MFFSKPHFINGNKDIGSKAQDEEDVGNGKEDHKVMAYVSDEPGGCQIQQNAHE